MAKVMQISVSIKDENGEEIAVATNERQVPYIEEIDAQGFRAAFHDLETAILEGRKEACDEALSEYLEAMSKKKQKQSQALGK